MRTTHGAEHKAAETVDDAQAAHHSQLGQLVADAVAGSQWTGSHRASMQGRPTLPRPPSYQGAYGFTQVADLGMPFKAILCPCPALLLQSKGPESLKLQERP